MVVKKFTKDTQIRLYLFKNVSITEHFRKNEVAEFQISCQNSNGPKRLILDQLAHDLSVSAFQYR